MRVPPAAALAAVLLFSLSAAAAQESPPADLEGWMRRQNLQFERAEGEKAIEEARARLEKDPEGPDSRYLLGRALGNAGRLDEARVQFEAALATDPHHAPSWRGMAVVHLNRGDQERALEEARKAWEIGKDLESLRTLVLVHFAKGERPAAYRLLEVEIARRPKDTGLRRVLAELLLDDGRFRDGEKELRQVLAMEPDDQKSMQSLVIVLLLTGQKDVAVEECRAFLKRHPRNLPILGALYGLLIENGELSSAAAVMEEILKCDLTPEKRAEAVERLKKIRMAAADGASPPKEADPKDLAEKLDSPDPAVRRDAMRVVWDQGFMGAKVVRMVLDEDETVRLYAVRILGRNRVPATASVLEALLFAPAKPESAVPVRAQAAAALGEIEVPAVLPVLVRCVAEEKSEEVLRAALLAIRKVTGKSFTEDAEAPIPEAERGAAREACRAWWTDHPTGKLWRRKAAASAGDMKEPCMARYCVPWVAEDDPAMRAAALDALARLTGDAKWRESPTETTEQRVAVLERALELLKAD